MAALTEKEDLDAEMVAIAFDGRFDLAAWRAWGATDREIVDWQPHYDPYRAGAFIGAGFRSPAAAAQVADLCEVDADVFAWGQLTAEGITAPERWMTAMPSPGRALARRLAVEWHTAGHTPTSAVGYLTAGIATPAEHGWWSDRCGHQDPVTVGAILRAEWEHRGFESSFVVESAETRHGWPAMIEARVNGLHDPDRARAWQTAAMRCGKGFNPIGAAAFEQAGLTPNEVADALTAVDVTAHHHQAVLDWFQEPDPTAAAVRWADQWASVPYATQWYAAGFTPIEAGHWRATVTSDVDVCAFWLNALKGTDHDPGYWQVLCGSSAASRYLCSLAIRRGKTPADVDGLLSPF